MGKVDERKIVERMKAGEVIVVSSKNGDSLPSFRSKPAAYRCKIGNSSIPGATVWKLINRRTIKCIHVGWFSEGQFCFNSELRDKRGRFRRLKKAIPHGR